MKWNFYILLRKIQSFLSQRIVSKKSKVLKFISCCINSSDEYPATQNTYLYQQIQYDCNHKMVIILISLYGYPTQSSAKEQNDERD